MAEIRDSVHGFIQLTDVERALIDTRPIQRLKYIHQLALSYLIYPGATHSRFEHALGTMHLAGMAFDAVELNSPDEARAIFGDEADRKRWRETTRVAGLLHDIGHAPFSHAGDELFSDAVGNHEEMSSRTISSGEIASILREIGTYRLDPAEVAYVATGIGTAKSQAALVAKELITGDLGVDRMDYLWRDSHMCGVSYGRFDLPRTVSTLMLERSLAGEVTLAIERGGLHAAEGLLTARYFMFSQVYFHDIRIVYDQHLLRFLQAHLPDGRYPESVDEYQKWDDVRVMTLLREHPNDPDAEAILGRRHFRPVYEFTPLELGKRLTLIDDVRQVLQSKFGRSVFVVDTQKSTRSMVPGQVFVVDTDTGRVDDILNISGTLESFKPIWLVRVFADSAIRTNVLDVVQQELARAEPANSQEDAE